MFEYDQKIVQTLLSVDARFKDLHARHHELKEKVREACLGTLAMDDVRLGTMKREKLRAKDQMAAMIEDYRRRQR